jgi:ankyrin repeat protein
MVFLLASFSYFIGAELTTTHGNSKSQGYSSSELRKAWNRCEYVLTHDINQKNSEKCKVIKALLEQYPDIVRLTDSNGNNLLMKAIKTDSEDILQLLLPHYVNKQLLNTQDFNGNSPLSIAVQRKSKYAIASLLLLGARTDIRNWEGLDPLHVSCTLEDPEMFYFMESVREKLNEQKTN